MNLRRLILVLTLCSALLPFANTFYAGYTVQRQQLIDTTQESNAAYARKLAQSTDDFLQSALQQLGYTAQLLADHMGDEPMLTQEATRLRLQTKSFNSVTIYNPQAIVLATSPEALQIKGRMLDSAAVQESLRTRSTVISQAYISAAGNLIVFISHPIFSPSGEYLGAIGGSIYLKQESMLNRLLGTHFYADGSYLYVVDKSKRIIYHPNPDRVGQVVTGNAVIDRVISGDSGYAAVDNSQGTAMLAGFAQVPSSGWGIVAQRPQQATLAPLDTLMRTVLYKTLPLTCVLLLVIWWGSRRIAQPLRQLANGAHTMDRADTAQTIQSVQSWYYEAQELKKAMLVGLGLLHKNMSQLRQDVSTDPLTGLGNRRHIDAALAHFASQDIPFAVVAIDIDHFKHVNDTFGHGVGDMVLKQLAAQMRDVCRADDVPCRVGGEEFLLLLPKASLADAAQVAERLRHLAEITELPVVGHITISVGVSHWPHCSASQTTVFKQADDMLYAAKHAGRNQVQVYPS
ncbi:sensor domain-containing diguanylate cyclase [Comamonas aquatica]|nr:sensor domain-containing diguanylate cyclase [Comamonas aquatica]